MEPEARRRPHQSVKPATHICFVKWMEYISRTSFYGIAHPVLTMGFLYERQPPHVAGTSENKKASGTFPRRRRPQRLFSLLDEIMSSPSALTRSGSMSSLAKAYQSPANDNNLSRLVFSRADSIHKSKTCEDLLIAMDPSCTRGCLQDSKGLQPDEKQETDAAEPLFVAQISDPDRCVLYDDPRRKFEGKGGEYVPIRRRPHASARPCQTDLVYNPNGWSFNCYGDTATYPFTYNEVVKQG